MAKNKTAAKPKSMSKTALYQELADQAGVTRKQVATIFEGLSGAIKKSLKKNGDVFTMHGLLKLKLLRKPAVKGGKMVPNPFRPGEMIMTKDKPARNVIKAQALKGLKDMVQ